MAGKGSTYRKVNGEAWEKGYARIDFSALKGSNKFAPPKQDAKLEFKLMDVKSVAHLRPND